MDICYCPKYVAIFAFRIDFHQKKIDMKPRHFGSILLFSFGSIFGFSQSFNMTLMSNKSNLPGGDASAVMGYSDDNGNEYAIIGSKTAINIYDVNDCADPLHKMSHYDGYNTSWREFATYQNYLYAICDVNCSSGLIIFNMDSINATPIPYTQYTNIFTKAHTIFIEKEEGRLYIMGSKNANNQNRLLVYTLDTEVINGTTYNGTAENPLLIREYITSYIHDMHVKNNIGYASHIYDYVLRVYDFSDVSNILLLHSHNYGSGSGKYNHSSWLADDSITIFEAIELPRGEPLRMFRKIQGDPDLELLGNIHEPLEYPNQNTRPHNPHIHEDLMYVSYYEDGVQVFDVSDLTNANSIKRIAYYDTYTQNNGNGYPNNFNGCWGVFPFLPSGCLLASDINNGLFTMKLDLPVDDGALPGHVTLVENHNLSFASGINSVILRSEKGYCFKIRVDEQGQINTQRVLCHTNDEETLKIFKNDLAFNDENLGILVKNDLGTCYKLKINNAGSFIAESYVCNFYINTVSVETGDIIIETPTKGIILANSNGCHRITVENNGQLLLSQLSNCP